MSGRVTGLALFLGLDFFDVFFRLFAGFGEFFFLSRSFRSFGNFWSF